MDVVKMKGINVSIGLGVIKERRLCEQIRGLIQACEFPHLKLFVHLAYATAGRSAALLGLTWDRCDFERDKIYLEDPTLTQPHKGRAIVPMTAALRSALLEAKGGALWRGNSSSLQGSIFSGASSGSLATRDLRCTRREIVIPALVRACPGHPDSQGTTAPFEWRARIRPGEYTCSPMLRRSAPQAHAAAHGGYVPAAISGVSIAMSDKFTAQPEVQLSGSPRRSGPAARAGPPPHARI